MQTFGTENTGAFATGSKAKALFSRNDRHLLDLAAAKTGQVPGRASKSTLLEALWLDFKNIARTSRSIGPAELGGSIADYAMPGDFTESNIKTHADKILRLLEDNTSPVAGGGDTPAQLTAKAALSTRIIVWEMAGEFVKDLRVDYDALTGTTSSTWPRIRQASKTPKQSLKSSSPPAGTWTTSIRSCKTSTTDSPKNSAPGSPPVASTVYRCGRGNPNPQPAAAQRLIDILKHETKLSAVAAKGLGKVGCWADYRLLFRASRTITFRSSDLSPGRSQ